MFKRQNQITHGCWNVKHRLSTLCKVFVYILQLFWYPHHWRVFCGFCLTLSFIMFDKYKSFEECSLLKYMPFSFCFFFSERSLSNCSIKSLSGMISSTTSKTTSKKLNLVPAQRNENIAQFLRSSLRSSITDGLHSFT